MVGVSKPASANAAPVQDAAKNTDDGEAD